MDKYRSIVVKSSNGGFGGPLTITPTEKQHKIMYLIAGGDCPEVVDKICELTGMEAVNGFRYRVQEEEMAVAVIDCGGSLRSGVYPRKGIPTINLVPTGKSGPLSEFMTANMYVSGVGVDEISLLKD